jgi:predicted RNA binding protein YcfA (HicA-like mRNA interferase family)
MIKMPALSPKDIPGILRERGFLQVQRGGRHQIWLLPDSRKRGIITMHNKDLSTVTVFDIVKQAEINKGEL